MQPTTTTEETVRYPSYWKCVQKGTVDGSVKRRPMDPQFGVTFCLHDIDISM